MTAFDWYVIQCHPHREAFVRERIRDLGRDVFLPLLSERRSKARERVLVPMFRGYLFALLCKADGDIPRVRWTHAVRRILGDVGGPRPIDAAVVETLRNRADRAGRVRTMDRFHAGERVRVVDGPLAGLIGIVEWSGSTPSERVCVLLDIFQRTTRVELSTVDVRSAAVTA